MTADETEYSGWKNYPTWAVNLWLANDEPLYRQAREYAAEAIENAPSDENVTNGIWTVEETKRFRLADTLKDWAEEIGFQVDNGEGGTMYAEGLTGFQADLYGWAFEQIDWAEIASAWIEDEE